MNIAKKNERWEPHGQQKIIPNNLWYYVNDKYKIIVSLITSKT